MSRPTAPAARPSKKPTRTGEGRSPHACGWFSEIALQLRKIFPHNCPAEIASRAGRSVSVAEKWLNGSVSPDGEALARLLRSDIGDLVHEALIASVKAPWADNLRAVREIARLRQQQADTARRLAALEGVIR